VDWVPFGLATSWDCGSYIYLIYGIVYFLSKRRHRKRHTREGGEGLSALKVEDPKLLVRASSLAVSRRAKNTFVRLDILFVGELVQSSRAVLLGVSSIGLKTVAEIEAALRKDGLRLGTSLPDWSRGAALLAESNSKPQIRALITKRAEQSGGKVPDQIDEALIYAMRRVEKNSRNIAVTIRHLGWDGQKKQTLESIGERLSVTRERVRQIVSRTTRALRKANFVPSAVERSIKLAERLAPALDTEVGQALLDAGLTTKPFGAAGLVSAAKVFFGRAQFTTVRSGAHTLILKRDTDTPITEITLRARRLVRARGCANTLDLADEFQESFGGPLSQSFITAMVSNNQSFEWLDQENGWFWYRPRAGRAHNRLVNYIKRVLAVAPSAQLSEIRSALRRHYRTANYAPPRVVLAAVCDRVPFAWRDGEIVVRREDAIDWNTVLGPTETMLKNVLQTHGPILRREELLERCLALGMNENTFTLHSSYSPILTRPAKGLYALAGTAVPAGTIEDIRRRSMAPKLTVVDHGWIADGRIYAAWRLNKSALFSGILKMPKSMSSFAEGNYRLITIAGEQLGGIEVRGQTCWNLKRLFRRAGAETEDNLAIIFDLKKREAVGIFSDDELLFDLTSVELALQAPAVELEENEDDDEAGF